MISSFDALTIAVPDTSDHPPSLVGENGLADSQDSFVAVSAWLG